MHIRKQYSPVPQGDEDAIEHEAGRKELVSEMLASMPHLTDHINLGVCLFSSSLVSEVL
jgi:hypothetical protein